MDPDRLKEIIESVDPSEEPGIKAINVPAVCRFAASARSVRLKRNANLREDFTVIQADINIKSRFSVSFLQIKTSPAPQPQSKRIAQNGNDCSVWICHARWKIARVNGTSMSNETSAAPLTAIPATSKTPQKTSNHGKRPAIEFKAR